VEGSPPIAAATPQVVETEAKSAAKRILSRVFRDVMHPIQECPELSTNCTLESAIGATVVCAKRGANHAIHISNKRIPTIFIGLSW
jgi:hydrogenase maturation factor